MKRIFNASFEHVETGISEYMVEHGIDTARSFRGIKAFAFLMLFGFFTFGFFFLVNTYVENNITDSVVPLDINNEFIGFMSSFWFYVPGIIAAILTTCVMLIFRKFNRPRGTMWYYLGWVLIMLFFLPLSFKTFQLMVHSPILRIIYTVAFVFTFFYVFYLSFESIKNFTVRSAKKRHFLIEFAYKHSNTILIILGIVGISYYLVKAFSPDMKNLEQRFIGNLAFVLPLGVVAANFIYLYLFNQIIRLYYISKYSEQFRKKYGYIPYDWYGPRYDRTTIDED